MANSGLVEQTDGVAMDSPLGPLLANVFMCHIENQLEQKSMIPSFYRRYVNDSLVTMPNPESATDFPRVLNSVHPSLSLWNLNMTGLFRSSVQFWQDVLAL